MTYEMWPADKVAELFEKFVFGFMTNDIRREIQLGYRTVAGKVDADLIAGGGNVLAALGLLTFTEFLGLVLVHTNSANKHWDEERRFNEGFRLLGGCYSAILDSKSLKPYHDLRSSLVHKYAVERGFDVDMPGTNADCGVILDVSDGRWHFVVERYFNDFSRASDVLYERVTGKSAVVARKGRS
jgi:hypothetical protein